MLILAGCTFILIACDVSLVMRNDLEEVRARGELTVIMRNSWDCYYEGAQGPGGFEYELVKAFADSLGVRLNTVTMEDEANMVEALLQGKADIVAAGIPFGRQSAHLLTLGPGYRTVQQKVVGRRDGPAVKQIEDLSGYSLWITPNSARIDLLKKLKSTYSDLKWQILRSNPPEELLEMVWNESVPLALIDSSTFKLNHRYYPELRVLLDLGQPQQLCWATAPNNRRLSRAVRKWFSKSGTKEIIQGLKEHYFSHLEQFDYFDLLRFRQRIGQRLPKYQPIFQAAAEQSHLDWLLVAALAYQESHWNPKSQSFTGVKGIMMLTQDTAKAMGVKDRLAVEETIFAGTRYLAQLHASLDDTIGEPDRTFMALAAYNVGLGHVRDALQLAAALGKPTDKWHGLRSVLPLLQQKKYYQDLPHGYARGSEAVQYVDRIRTYHRVLSMVAKNDLSAQAEN